MSGELSPADLADVETLALAQQEIRACMAMVVDSRVWRLPDREAYWSRRADLAALAYAAVDRTITEQHRGRPVHVPGQLDLTDLEDRG